MLQWNIMQWGLTKMAGICDNKILNEFSWKIVFQFLYHWIIFLPTMLNWK